MDEASKGRSVIPDEAWDAEQAAYRKGYEWGRVATDDECRCDRSSLPHRRAGGCDEAGRTTTEDEFHCDICGSDTHDALACDPLPVKGRTATPVDPS